MTAPQLTAQIQGQGTVSADQLNTYLQWCSNTAQLRAFIGLPDMEVFLQGTNSPGDGGQGAFYWNVTSLGPDDNGITTIVPQPGVPGAWVRIPLSFGSYNQTIILTTSSTLKPSEFNSIIELTGSTAFTTTFPATATIGISSSIIWNMSTMTQTFIGTTNFLGPNGSGTTTQTLAAGQIMMLSTDGTNLIVNGPFPSQSVLTSLIQSGSTTYSATDTGSANAYVIALTPPITSYTDGQIISFRAANSNSGASTLNAGGGALGIRGNAVAVLQGGEIVAGRTIVVQYSLFSNIFFMLGGSFSTQVGPAVAGAQAPSWTQIFAGNNVQYSNVSGSRFLGVTYTNPFSRPILARVVVTSTMASGMIITINGVNIGQSTDQPMPGDTLADTFIVPIGGTYSVGTTAGSPTLVSWFEL